MKYGSLLACGALFSTAGLACLLAQHIIMERRQPSQHRAQSNKRFKRDMCEHEYVALIPMEELKPLRALLRRIHRQRGWSTQLAHLDAAWEQVVQEAQTLQGGAWHVGLCGEGALCSESLRKLSMVIDGVFLAGALQQRLLSFGKQPVGFRVVEEAPGPDDWISYFDEQHNQIVLRRHRWGLSCLDVSEERPMSCEGMICTTNLQVLAHTIAHEMVHALVYNFFPAIDASSEAYLPDERHGPIFKLLNKHLFGHTIDSFRQVFKIG
ncbi:hypothetical protein DUNSADRAFT_1333 [Dunaliella salina]|uniref:SprT-like domain-containing protein n=1 Tax=Dunaliella salina TaxID=3046 RepID=A0ABQ7GX58_DUNSA|nr:hypothetical protein DUNSADRAFT_1333 [Dunaliella salina]|eukprot:KAF5839197.1 hypothetical protein DUNSADRAFT_1333 [Dunaliella salina]